MPKPIKKSAKKADPMRAILENLVAPALRENNSRHQDDMDSFEIEKEDGKWQVSGILEGGQWIFVTAEAIDRERTQLSFDLAVGFSFLDFPYKVLLISGMLEGSHCHMRGGVTAAYRGKLDVGFDLVVRADDELLVRQRIQQLVNVGLLLEWYFMLRMPERIEFDTVLDLVTQWPEWDFIEQDELLDKELEMPAFDRHAEGATIIARGLGRWEDVLRLLNEHSDEIPAEDRADLEFIALRGLGRWRPAIEAAERAGIKDGRFDYEPWLNPPYLHCLIEDGCDIEALKLLGAHKDDEPPFYDWLRGFALQRAGDRPGAEKCYRRYDDAYPGDLHAMTDRDALLGEGDDD